MPFIPSIPQVRDDEKSGHDSSKKVTMHVEAPCVQGRGHHAGAAFIARGIDSRDEARRTGQYLDAHVVLERLRSKLDETLTRMKNSRG